MSNVFISHRSGDLGLARKLSAELKSHGHAVWLDDESIIPGDSIVKEVESGLMGAGYVILCLSSEGLSDWVDREWMSTLARRLDGVNVKLLPVLLSGGKIPAILADIKYVDLVRDWGKGIDMLCTAIR
jgi:TIR domain